MAAQHFLGVNHPCAGAREVFPEGARLNIGGCLICVGGHRYGTVSLICPKTAKYSAPGSMNPSRPFRQWVLRFACQAHGSMVICKSLEMIFAPFLWHQPLHSTGDLCRLELLGRH